MDYVFLSITTTKGNAFKNGEIVELGAVKYDKRGKMLKTFDVINRLPNLDDFSDSELSCGRDMVIRNGESVKTWLIRLYDFIGDSKVIMFEAYETYNYLRSYGLDLTNILDMRLLLWENKTKDYDNFLKLTSKHIKGNLKVSKKILKPVILKEIFFGLKLNRKTKFLNEYTNDVYVKTEVVKYNGVLTDDEVKNKLYFADGRVEDVVDEMELYERHLKNVYLEEKGYFGESFEDVLIRFRESFEDVYFKNTSLGDKYFRADIEGRVYLITPTTLSFDDDLKISQLYDIKTMSKLDCFKIIEDNVSDDLVANFFKDIVKTADPDYEVRTYEYFLEVLGGFISDINSRLSRINDRNEILRKQMLASYELSNIADDKFILEFREYNGLVTFSVDEVYRDIDLSDDEEPEGNRVLRLKNRDIDKRVKVEDYEISFDSERYNYLVYELGIKPLEDSLKGLTARTNKLVQDMERNLPVEKVRTYNVDNVNEKVLLDVYYGVEASYVYSKGVVKNRGAFVRVVNKDEAVRMFISGEIDFIDSGGRETSIHNLNIVLDKNEALYFRIKEHYTIMDKLFRYNYNDFKVEEDDLVTFNHQGDGEEFEDFEVDDGVEMVTNLDDATIVSKVFNEYEVSLSLDRIFDVAGIKNYFAGVAEKQNTSSVEFASSVKRHREVLEKIINEVNDRITKGDVSRGSSRIIFRDGICRLSDDNYYIEYDGVEIHFENDRGNYKITYIDDTNTDDFF